MLCVSLNTQLGLLPNTSSFWNNPFEIQKGIWNLTNFQDNIFLSLNQNVGYKDEPTDTHN